ncbi:hypothetical protein QE390_003135 [Siphonobacter sp. SORGH_AS 1065]|nr:hypothetical protein [Siphonobacter sp. SORGH_AS_1065]
MISIILVVYFTVKGFMAGYQFKAERSEGLKKAYLSALIAFLVGDLMLIYYFITEGLDRLDSYLPIKFFFKFYFTRKFSSMKVEHLRIVNYIANQKWTSKWRKNVFMLTLRMVNRRNNYKPI